MLEIPVRELHNDLVEAANNGDLPEAVDRQGRIIVSDTKLRAILPPELRRATKQHKQMCGCETCYTIKWLHSSLVCFRSRIVATLGKEIKNDELDTEEKNKLTNKLDTYKNLVFWTDLS